MRLGGDEVSPTSITLLRTQRRSVHRLSRARNHLSGKGNGMMGNGEEQVGTLRRILRRPLIYVVERGSAPPYVRNGDTSRRVQNGYNRFVVNEEAQIPAWMDDQQPSIEPGDSAIEKAVESDPLVKFIPGEDMIAVHKRAMKSRDTEGGWRGVEKPLSPFFDPDPVIASSSAAPGLPPGLPLPLAKTKVFNAADYLRPNKDQIDGDSEKEAIEHNINPNAFQSRFQRFFAGPSSIPSGPEGSGPPESNRSNSALDSQSMMMSPSIPPPRDVRSPPQRSPSEGEEHEPRRSDDRMATLMGLLSNKVGCSAYKHARDRAEL